MSAPAWIEALAAALGLLGTALLACRVRWAGWGFVAYLGSNAGWVWFALQHGHWGLFWQQVGFTVFSLVGVWKWLVVPARDALDWEEFPVGYESARCAGYSKPMTKGDAS